MASNARKPRTLARALYAKIEADGLTHGDVAKQLGVNESRVSRYLRGDAPSTQRIPAMARFLNLTEAQVLQLVYDAQSATRVASRADLEARLTTLEEQVAVLTERLDQPASGRSRRPRT